jgi:hypothetical protein
MKRTREFNTPQGQAAWLYYQTWFKTMKKMPPRADAFLTSSFYRTFNNFAEFARKVQLPTPDKFIWLMVEKDLPPNMWMRDEPYAMYMDYLEHRVPPMDQVRLSIDTLFSYADRFEVDVGDIFEHLHPSDLIQLVRTRRVSPWLLLCSKKFKMFFVDKASQEQQMILETLIRFDSWAERLSKDPVLTENIKRCVRELNL